MFLNINSQFNLGNNNVNMGDGYTFDPGQTARPDAWIAGEVVYVDDPDRPSVVRGLFGGMREKIFRVLPTWADWEKYFDRSDMENFMSGGAARENEWAAKTTRRDLNRITREWDQKPLFFVSHAETMYSVGEVPDMIPKRRTFSWTPSPRGSLIPLYEWVAEMVIHPFTYKYKFEQIQKQIEAARAAGATHVFRTGAESAPEFGVLGLFGTPIRAMLDRPLRAAQIIAPTGLAVKLWYSGEKEI